MKQRVSSLDVKVLAHELSRSLHSLRLSNVYDLSSRIFLLKFAKPDHRQQLLVDAGFRCHLTSFARATAATPSPFVARLRKYLRTRRVTNVVQVGTDRIIEIEFSDGQYRLFLEFYAGGNIILADKELNILALWRVVSEGTEPEQVRVGVKYSMEDRQNINGVPALTEDRVRAALQATSNVAESEVPHKKAKKKAGNALRKALAMSLTEFPPMLVDHAFRVTDFDVTLTPVQVLEDDKLLGKLVDALSEAERVIQQITSTEMCTGYIIAKPAKAGAPKLEDESHPAVEPDQARRQNIMYDDFHPFKPQQFEDDPEVEILNFDGFNRTVDEFFSSIEGQKLESRLQDREEHAKKKLEAARKDHEKRLGGLQTVQELNVRKAQAIESNVQRVEEAIAAVNGLIAQGMDWVEIARLIEMEQSRQNAVAGMIKLPLKLYENTATLLLGEAEDDDDYEGDETDSDVSASEDEDESKPKAQGSKQVDKLLAVDVDLALSPWANARQYYEQKRTAAVKEQKTLQSSSKALKSTERKITADLKKGLKQEKAVLRPVRNQFWFEKFIFFISSDGYLVLGGKDIQQNEILYKRYLKRGDIYVHADVQGAATLIIKNSPSTPDAPIPPSTLSQAGTFSIATSTAWDSKAVMSAWWVDSDQVSKTAPNGDFLGVGGFHIQGKKNFLPPAQLLLGFGVLFQISEASLAGHTKRRVRSEDEQAGGSKTADQDNNADTVEDEDAITQPDSKDDDEGDDDEAEEENEEIVETDSEAESDDDDGGHQSDARQAANPLQSGVGIENNLLRPDNSISQQSTEPDHASEGVEARSEDEKEDEGEGDAELITMEQPATGADLPTTTPSTGHRHLSARERRLLRRGQPVSDLASSAPSSTDTDDPNPTSNSTDPSTTATTPTKPTKPLPRGKRAKQKKLATKYAHQDESDRLLAMSLLGSAASADKAATSAAALAQREKDADFHKQRRREQHERAALAGKAHEAARLHADDEAVEDETHSLAILDQFVSKPLAADEILEAIPVCAPWTAMGTYKYKAKLQPGTTKKGKAVKEILGRWVGADEKMGRGELGRRVDDKGEDDSRMWPRERELIRYWREAEVVNTVVVGKCRVMLGKAGVSGGGAGGAAKGGKGKRGGRGSKKK